MRMGGELCARLLLVGHFWGAGSIMLVLLPFLLIHACTYDHHSPPYTHLAAYGLPTACARSRVVRYALSRGGGARRTSHLMVRKR